MANGERCVKCGSQETDHEHGEAFVEPGKPCEVFVSEVTHLKSCPVVDCNGDCEAFMRQVELRQRAEWDKIQH